jgi:PAS domain-containing protein
MDGLMEAVEDDRPKASEVASGHDNFDTQAKAATEKSTGHGFVPNLGAPHHAEPKDVGPAAALSSPLISEEVEDFSAMIAGIDIGFCLLSEDLDVLYMNAAMIDIWKVRNPTDCIGKSFVYLVESIREFGLYDVADEDWDEFVEARLDAIRTGHLKPTEIPRADGATLVISANRLPSGKYALSYTDITDQKKRDADAKKAEETAEEARDLVNYVVSELNVGIVVFDQNDKLVLANRRINDFYPEGAKNLQVGTDLREGIKDLYAKEFDNRSDVPANDAPDYEAWLDDRMAEYYQPEFTKVVQTALKPSGFSTSERHP